MKQLLFSTSLKILTQCTLIFSVLGLAFGGGSVHTVSAGTPSSPESCGQLLADAEARFLDTLAPDGSVPATEETRTAALDYIRVSKLCYEELEAQSHAGALQEEPPLHIDDGGLILNNESFAEYVATNRKWGSGTQGTSGGTVTYSFMGSGLSFSDEGYGDSVAFSALPGFQVCFITEIQNAFSAWQAVANIRFEQVSDSGSDFNVPGATGDIRIGAHTFDGPSGTLAHAYYPPPNGSSAAGDMHFDSSENWTCNASGIDIGVVALHEIGHSLGLAHENTSTTAVMDPIYNPSLPGLQSDDINGAVAIYGPAELLAPPSNDNFANAKTISSVPYNDSISTADATVEDQEVDAIVCAGNTLRGGIHTVWYKHTPGTSGPLTFSTAGSSYDTYVAVWTGSALNNLTLVGCNDDVQSGLTSQLSINSTAGVTYFVQVAEYNGYVGDAGNDPECNPCNLTFSVNNQPIQTFADVPPTHPYYQYIEALYANGLTAGCANNPLRYCPSTAMDRAQSAVFMMRGTYGSSYVPPAGLSYLFQDNWSPGTWARPWAEAMRSTNLTTGCQPSPLLYCPWVQLPREQVVIFALKLKYGNNYNPPAATGTLFADLTNVSHYATPWAEKAYLDGLIPACGSSGGKPMFCPSGIVDRGLAAYVVTKAKGIVP